MKIHTRYGFTLLELLVTGMILLVLASVGMAMYGRYRDRAAMLVDETNEKVLLAAAKLYAYDNNALPGNLSELRPQDLERAYAEVTDGKRPYTFFASLQEMVGLADIAEAGPIDKYLTGNTAQIEKIKTCPSDKTPPSSADGYSYGIPAAVAGKPLSWLLNPSNADTAIIVETDVAVAAPVIYSRHGGTCMVISVSGIIRRCTTYTLGCI